MVRIVTDTSANLPSEVIDRYGIELVPLYLTFGDRILREHIDLPSGKFHAMLHKSGVNAFPTTSQPPVHEFETVYNKMIAQNAEEPILSIHVSGALSGTLASAQLAIFKNKQKKLIHSFDTRSCMMAHGMIVERAAEMAKSGEKVESIIAELEKIRERMRAYFALDSLSYLAEAGRLLRLARMSVTLGSMKPVITLRKGALESYAAYDTRHKALEDLRNLTTKLARNKKKLMIGVMYSDPVYEAEARLIVTRLKENLEGSSVQLGMIGPSFSIYFGVETIGVCWYYAGDDSD